MSKQPDTCSATPAEHHTNGPCPDCAGGPRDDQPAERPQDAPGSTRLKINLYYAKLALHTAMGATSALEHGTDGSWTPEQWRQWAVTNLKAAIDYLGGEEAR